MVDQVVNLIIAVDRGAPIRWLQMFVPEEIQHFFNMGYLSHRFIRLHVPSLCLCFADCREGFDLAIVETGRSTKTLKSDVFRIDSVKFG